MPQQIQAFRYEGHDENGLQEIEDSPKGQMHFRKAPQPVDPLLTAEEVAQRLRVSRDWVWDHSSRKSPRLPAIRMGDGALRYRASRIEEFIGERERLSATSHGRR
jgi:predicted DNA-binding transcriptional regulator AlpA